MMSLEEKGYKNLGVGKFIGKRIKNVGGQYFLAFGVALIVNFIINDWKINIRLVVSCILEILLVQEWGILNTGIQINSLTWYISAMFLVSIVIYILRKLLRDNIVFAVVLGVIAFLLECKLNN